LLPLHLPDIITAQREVDREKLLVAQYSAGCYKRSGDTPVMLGYLLSLLLAADSKALLRLDRRAVTGCDLCAEHEVGLLDVRT